MISWTQVYQKAQLICGDSSAATKTQLQQDINIGYKRFNAALNRYFTRKQAFTDLVAAQQYYQTPVDTIKVMQVSVKQSNGYEYPVEELRSEREWREINITPYSSTYAQFYYVTGDDQIGLWPTPSATVSAGLRYVYAPQDVDLTKDDYSTGTVTVTNGSATVTGSGTTWTIASHQGSYIQITDGTDGNWYYINSVNSTTSITLKSAYTGPSGATKAYTIGQMMIIPGEYSDAPIDYALARFFESRNNPQRATYHMTNFKNTVKDAEGQYASSSTSSVITSGNEMTYNWWFLSPPAG